MVDRPYDYVAYIDEAGDYGLKNIRPNAPTGSSEWFVMGAAVIHADREHETIEWVRGINRTIRSQRPSFHFRDIKIPAKRAAVCSAMADFPARYFVVASNKKNMQRHRNPFAAAAAVNLVGVPEGWNHNWFYYWISRVLLEKVSDFVRVRSMLQYGEPRKLRIEFSENQALRYNELGFYFDLLKMHDQKNTQVVTYDQISWDVMDRDLVFTYPHAARAGFQLADASASAFFQACDLHHTGGIDRSYARLLRPRMARRPENKAIAGYGVKLMPSLHRAKLLPEQAQIFLDYGYPSRRW